MKKQYKTNLAVIAISLLLAGIILLATKAPAPVTASATAILASIAVITAFFAFRQLNVIKAQSHREDQLFVNGIKSSLADIKIEIAKHQEKQIPYAQEAGRKKPLSKKEQAVFDSIKRQILLAKIKYYNIFEDLCIYILYHKNKEFINFIRDHHNWINGTVKELFKDEILREYYKKNEGLKEEDIAERLKKDYPSIHRVR